MKPSVFLRTSAFVALLGVTLSASAAHIAFGFKGAPKISSILELPATGQAALAVQGDLQAVPEPASWAAMGLGLAVFVRRRRGKEGTKRSFATIA